MNCDPIIQGDRWYCRRCKRGDIVRGPGRIVRVCTVEKPKTLPELFAELHAARLRFKAAGSPLLSHQETAARLEVCRACPSGQHSEPFGFPMLERCGACGCFLRLKAKMATEHCPRQHWPGDPEGGKCCG